MIAGIPSNSVLVVNLEASLSLTVDFVLGCKGKAFSVHHRGIPGIRVQCSQLEAGAARESETSGKLKSVNRRVAIGLICGVAGFVTGSMGVNGAGLPPEEKPRLCDDSCEKELENVW